MKCINKNTSFVFFYMFVFFLGCMAYGDKKAPSVNAKAAIIIDADTGCVIYEKNADKKFYPASITKILTGYLGIVQGGDRKKKITVSRKAAWGITPGSSSISLKPGEIVALKDVLYGLMLRSANECGNVIAEHISGSNSGFALLMNKTAKEWGLKNTNFVNPHGLHKDKHKSTARDMAIIAKHAMENEVFRKIIKTRYYAFPDTNKHKGVERGKMTNKNKMLHPHNDAYYKYCIGIKAGYTKRSLHTFVAAAEKNGHMVIVSLMKVSDKKRMYSDLKNLMEYGLEQFEERTLINKGDMVESKKFKYTSGVVELVAKDTLKKDLPKQCKDIEKRELFQKIKFPVHEGDVLGEISFFIKDSKIGSIPVIASNTVVSVFSWHYIKGLIFSIPVFVGIGLIITLYLFYLGSKTPRNRSRYR
ncbi:MAG: D-alanyl-D-alanine carboxypeptidase [Candidatus Aureabacteria bacterium]|nr:D-alanyl-D-alanine carboxypeptidase [Candidatus Auribacterota bacterium]